MQLIKYIRKQVKRSLFNTFCFSLNIFDYLLSLCLRVFYFYSNLYDFVKFFFRAFHIYTTNDIHMYQLMSFVPLWYCDENGHNYTTDKITHLKRKKLWNYLFFGISISHHFVYATLIFNGITDFVLWASYSGIFDQ